MSYPRNAATPKAVTVGSLVKVSDGSLLAATAGVAVRVDLDGGGWGAGGGTIAVDATSSTFTYAPIQAETNGDVLKVALYIAGYVSISQNVIMDPLDLAVNATKISGDSDAADNLEAMFDGTGYAGGTIKLAVDLSKILGTDLTETSAGYLAAALVKLLDVATPGPTLNDLANKGDEMDLVDAPNATAVAALKANVAEVAAVAAVAEVAPTAAVAETAPTALVAAVAAVAEIAPTAAVAAVAETAAVATTAPTAAVAATAEVAGVAPTAAVAAVAAVADPTDPALIADEMEGVPLTLSLADATGALPAEAFDNQPAAVVELTEEQIEEISNDVVAGVSDALDVITAKTNLITAGSISIVSAVEDDGTVNLVQGDAYTTAMGRQLTWTADYGGTQAIADATLTFWVVARDGYKDNDGSGLQLGTVTGSEGTSDVALTVELTSADTALLEGLHTNRQPTHRYEIRAEWTGGVVNRLARGDLRVYPRIGT